MSDRSILINISLLGVLAFLVLSSGVFQCVFNCIEEDAYRRTALQHNAHESHVADCHLTIPEPKQVSRCPDRSCHQNQAASRSLGGPVLTNHTNMQEPLLSSPRLPLPDLRTGEPAKVKIQPQPVLLATWQPPTTISQTLLSVRSTVLLN